MTAEHLHDRWFVFSKWDGVVIVTTGSNSIRAYLLPPASGANYHDETLYMSRWAE